jgi:hypothetical protein
MTTDIFCFYLRNRLIQSVKREVNSTVILPTLVFPDETLPKLYSNINILMKKTPHFDIKWDSSRPKRIYGPNDEPPFFFQIKWYKGTHEFYRYSPNDESKTKLFLVENLNVDVSIGAAQDVIFAMLVKSALGPNCFVRNLRIFVIS